MKLICTLPLALLLSFGCKSEAPAPGAKAGAESKKASAELPTAKTSADEAKKKAEQAERLVGDWKKLEESTKKESARWTSEMKATTEKIATADYKKGAEAVKAVLAGAHRTPGNSDRDAFRHPAETLEFFGFAPDQTVFEYGPGGGWYTEVLAPALAKKGKLIVNNGDPKGPKTERGTYYAARFANFLAKSPEAYGKVEQVVVDSKNIDLKQDGKVDLALVVRGMHGMLNRGQVKGWFVAIHKALKAKGTLGVVQHRAAADAKAKDSTKKGYLPEAWVIEQAKAAGFKLVAKSEINANAKDTKDYENGVWTLPPVLGQGDKERSKYTAIGESDRMTLRFEKI